MYSTESEKRNLSIYSENHIKAFTAISEKSENRFHSVVLKSFFRQMYGFKTQYDINLAQLATFVKSYQIKDEKILKNQ